MSEKSVLFITNGNTKIGYGHISRDLVIAEKFKENNWYVCFSVPNNSPFVTNISSNNNVIAIEPFDMVSSEKEISNIVISEKIDVIIIDLIEEEYLALRWLKDVFPNVFIASITLFLFDINTRYEDISFFPDINKIQEEGNIPIFSGPEYLVFRDEFKNISRRNHRGNANNILISMGGTDPLGLSLKIVESLINEEGLNITVLLSKHSPVFEDVKKIIDNKCNFKLIESSDNMAGLMSEHDIMVLNGGLTRYEACLAQLPFIAISIHETQYNITKKITDKGVGVNLGIAKDIKQEEIRLSVYGLLNDLKLRESMQHRMRSLFDANGAEQIFEKIIQMKYSHEKNN